MRLLQAMAGAPHGGAELFFERLAIALNKRPEIEQRVLIRRDPQRKARLFKEGIEARELAFGGIFDLATPARFRAEIRGFAPQAVLTWMNRATGRCPGAKGRFVHIGRLGGYYNLKYYRHCDHLIGNTQGIVDYLVREGWPAARAHYVPNFVPDTQEEPVPRGTFDTPDDAPLVLGMGRLHQNKAFDVLLEALVDLPKAYLWLAGDGPLDQDLRQLADKLGVRGRVRFLGWRADGPALLAAADVLVCPSRVEPLGNVILEAWAHGVPVVAATSEGPSALIRDRVNGILTPVDDSGAMAGALDQLVSNPELCRKLAAAGREEYESHYSEQIVTDHYVEFLEKVISACAV